MTGSGAPSPAAEPIRVFLLDDHEVVRRGVHDLLDAVMAGASRYVLKQITGTDLVTAVRTVASGRSMLDPGATTRLMARMRGEVPEEERAAGLPGFTDREKEILLMVSEGLTNREIGKRLYLAEKTVKNIISRLFIKLGVERRVQAAVIASHALTPPGRHPAPARAAELERPAGQGRQAGQSSIAW
ncbi:response regulator transcription factor [Streptomyces lavendulae]|uniref:response regulator transcription factor n=1 Tax=Streptomyces lavendulae TaxID=1914 RepID=UPI0036E02024